MTYNLESNLGEHISRYAERLVAYCQELIKTDYLALVECKFNGFNLLVDGNTTAEKIVEQYHGENKKTAKAYRESREYILRQRKDRKDLRQRQKKHDTLVKRMRKLDYSNSNNVLEWVMEYYNTTDHVGVKNNFNKVYYELMKNGYAPNANLGIKLNREDRDNVARYIIGQFMESARLNRACPQMITSFYDEYLLKFIYNMPAVKIS